MSSRLRIGVIGAGSIAVRGILPHLSQDDVQDRIQLAAICDPVEGRAEAACERFGGELAFTDYDDLLANGNVDLVTIASPIGLHYEQGRKALEAGKHVHFNKTMTTTTAEATDLIDFAKERGLRIVASPGQMLRPELRRAKELIDEGAIGDLCWAVCGAAFGTAHAAETVRQGDDVLSNINPSWYYRKPGGGPLYDMTVYSLHSITGTLGPVRRVTAMSGVRVPEREFRGEMYPCDADDNSLMLLDFGNSLFALAFGVASRTSPLPDFNPAYYGTAGVIAGRTMNGVPFDFPGSDEATPGPKGKPVPILPHVTGTHRDIQEAHVFEDIMQLVDWVRDGTPTIVTAEHARHVIEIIEAGYTAAETGQAQTLQTTFEA